MSTLVPRPGTSPLLAAGRSGAGGAEAVQVLDLSATGGDDQINLQQIWRAIQRRRRLVLLVAGGVLALSAALTLKQRLFSPVYEGSFQLLISDPISTGNGNGSSAGGAADDGGGVIESLARNRTSADIPTLTQVLTSPLVLEPVARSIGLDSDSLQANLSVQLAGDRRRAGSGSPQGVLQVALQGSSRAAVERSLQGLSQAYLAYALAQRQERLGEGLRFLSRQEPLLEAKVAGLQNDLAAFRQRHNLLAPEAEGTALKAEVATLQQQGRQVEAERARLLQLRQDVASGRLTAANFSTSPPTTSSTGIAADTVAVTQANSDKLDQLRSVEQQLAEARAVYRSDSPRVRTLVALRDQLTGQLRANQLEAVDTALSLNATRGEAVRQQVASVDRQFLRQPQLIKQYEELQQRLKVAQGNLSNFLTTRETFRLEQAQNIAPWKVIAPPQVSTNPVSPSVPRNLALGALLGLVAGAGAGLLRDRLDHVFHHPSEVRDELGQPLLGHIPHVPFFKGVREEQRFLLEELDRSASPTGSGDPDGADPGRADTGGAAAADGAAAAAPPLDRRSVRYHRFFYQEAFRNLFTSLRFLNADRPLRSVALTSSVPAEGKSLINVLLAKTLSELGQRVLLVDADLRKPQMHHRLGLDNLIGLSNLLTGDVADSTQAIQPVPGRDNWWVITAGRRPPDPARLLSSQRMRELVAELAECGRYDLILYDTPPALGLADAALVAEQVDGLILLVSLDRVDRHLPLEAVERLRSTGAPLLGVVTNAVRQEPQLATAYGYNRYGSRAYGSYGSYDYRTAYAYYSDDDTNKPEAAAAAAPRRGQRLRERLLRWIDGE